MAGPLRSFGGNGQRSTLLSVLGSLYRCLSSLSSTDFTVWQRQWLQGEVLETQLAYWKRQFGDPLPVLELPTDRPHPSVQTFQGTRQSLVLSASLATALKGTEPAGRRHTLHDAGHGFPDIALPLYRAN